MVAQPVPVAYGWVNDRVLRRPSVQVHPSVVLFLPQPGAVETVLWASLSRPVSLLGLAALLIQPNSLGQTPLTA